MPDERVYVVARRAVPGGADWYGLRTDGLAAFVAALERDGRYELRERMERDPTFKQVIPYVVLRDEERYFLMQRTSAGGDARLHGRYSIGVGGHLNPATTASSEVCSANGTRSWSRISPRPSSSSRC